MYLTIFCYNLVKIYNGSNLVGLYFAALLTQNRFIRFSFQIKSYFNNFDKIKSIKNRSENHINRRISFNSLSNCGKIQKEKEKRKYQFILTFSYSWTTKQLMCQQCFQELRYIRNGKIFKPLTSKSSVTRNKKKINEQVAKAVFRRR